MQVGDRTLCSNEGCAKRFDCFRYTEYVRKANQVTQAQKFKPNKQGDCWVFIKKRD
jgi:hypothetical protein